MTIWRCELLPQTNLYREKMRQAFEEVLDTGRYVLGEYGRKFEQEFAEYIGVKYCISVANGTDALVLALKALGVKAGDEVITTPYTAIPTISAIVLAGAKPVFVDIDPETFLLDIDNVKAVISSKTRAIVPVHLFSQMVDIRRLRSEIGADISILEDAAQAHGCRLNGEMAGSLGDVAAFSFFPTKNLGGFGDGGCVTTNSDLIAAKIRLMRNYGKQTPDEIVLDGGNSRLDELQAAFLSIKLPDLEVMNAKRRAIAEIYASKLGGLPIEVPKIQAGAIPNYHVFVVQVAGARDELKKFLLSQSIQTDIFYPEPHHLQPCYRGLGYKEGDFPNAEAVGKRALALPFYPEIENQTLEYISQKIREFFEDKQ